MNWSNVAKGAAIVALLGSAPLQAGAMEIVGGTSPAAQMNEGFVQTVVIVRGPHGGAVVRPGVHGYHPGYRPGYGYHPGYRPGYPGYRPGYAGWARPGWYHWGPGGAIAAGAAIGVLGAAAVAAWAPPPPAPGLCWYYTDPSQRNGFWDACQ
ncbi:MAG TPA: hypothetical protein VKG91_08925 [Roseiarcus sp.]|nr:hypothetical protein [Roseiarcus sp.]